MILKDAITTIGLIIGLTFVTVVIILTKQGKLKLETWPPIFGIGGAICLFVSLMIQSIFSTPPSKILDYTVTNLTLSFALGIAAYFSMLRAVSGKRNRN